MAKRIGVSKDTICHWEGNATAPDLRLVPRIIRFLGYAPAAEGLSPGVRLVAHRRALGLSQSEMARRLGIDPGTLSRWERGQQSRRRTHAGKVVDELFLSMPQPDNGYGW